MTDVRMLRELPGVGGLMLKAGLTAVGRPGASAGLPDRSAVVTNLAQDPARLAAYNRVCGFTLRNEVPPTWLHVLTFPLHGYLMAERDFPFPLAGLVHVTNEMTLHRPVSVSEKLHITVTTRNLAAHKRGATFDLAGKIRVGSELVWTGVSNYIALGAKMPGEPAAGAERLELPEVAPSQFWRLPADLGRQYAAVSDDNNPIHLYPATAKLFGFKRPIVHGMWTHARALAALEPRLPSSYSVKVAFTKPIGLPGRATFAAQPVGDDWRFAVLNTDGTKPYLVGEVTP